MKILLVAIVFLMTSCGGTDDSHESKLKQEIDLSQSKDCRHEGACAVVETGCNISCSVAVFFTDKDRIDELVENVKLEHAKENKSCHTTCIPKELACVDYTCVMVDL